MTCGSEANNMIFLGSMLSADIMSVPCTPTDINDITRIELSDAMYDDLRVTKNVTEELSSVVNPNWDWDTILHAKFDGNTSAGNVNWDLESVSHLIIRRKQIDEFKWTTIKVQKVKSIKDFNTYDIDITAAAQHTYQYAAVPIIRSMEGFYSIDTVDVKSQSLLIADRDEIWDTKLTDNYLDNTSVVPSNVVTTMYDRYPTIVRNTAANYEEITVNAQFFPLKDDGCSYDIEDQKRIDYNKRAKMFLRNGNVKILKSIDGNIWLVYVTTPPSDTAVDHYKNRKITFSCTEVGDPNSEEDLYNAGLIPTVTPEWWNR